MVRAMTTAVVGLASGFSFTWLSSAGGRYGATVGNASHRSAEFENGAINACDEVSALCKW